MANVRSTPVRFQKRICDRARSVSTDRTLGVQRPVEYSKVPVREKYDRTRPVSGDRTLPASGQHLNTIVRVELTGASGHPAEAHNGSFFSRCYKYFSLRVRGYFCSFQQLRNTFVSAKKSKVLVRCL